MSLDRLRVSEGFVRTAKHLDARDRARVYTTAEDLAAEFPALPSAEDETVDAPPTGRFYARRVRGTALRVLYTVAADAVVIRSVNYV